MCTLHGLLRKKRRLVNLLIYYLLVNLQTGMQQLQFYTPPR